MATDVKSIWRFVSNFFNFLSEEDRERYENIWEGQALIANDLDNKSARLVLSESPEDSVLDPTIEYYDVPVGILLARPIQLDPTVSESRYIMTPKRRIETLPIGTGRDSVRNDLIEIGPKDYADIRDIGIGTYCVIDVSDDDIPTKYFTVNNIKAPIEVDAARYDDLYVIELEGANLSYIPDDVKFTIYLTTGRVYAVDTFVIDIPTLSSNIQDTDSDGNVSGVLLNKGTDFTFDNSTVEFESDLIKDGVLSDGDVLYAKNIDIIEHNLFSMYGTLTGIKDWRKFKYDNISGKAAINSLVKSLQNPSKRENYERALNVYYGLPVAPTDLTVVGLYESYDYEILAINVGLSQVTLELKTLTNLHEFIQPGTKFMVDGKNFEVNIPYNSNESSVMTRATGVIKLNDMTNIAVGDKLNVRLANKLKLNNVNKPLFSDSVITATHWTAGGEFQHLSDITYAAGLGSGFTRYPQLVIYNSKDEGSSRNLDGLYHIKSTQKETGATFPAPNYTDNIEFMIDDKISLIEEPSYNDFIDLDDGESYVTGAGYVHIPWPTHKYILATLDDGTYYKMYIDAPIDTMYDKSDKASKYDVLCSCVSSFDKRIFPYWNEFNGFRTNSGIDVESNILELLNVIPHTKFGEYFPNSI